MSGPLCDFCGHPLKREGAPVASRVQFQTLLSARTVCPACGKPGDGFREIGERSFGNLSGRYLCEDCNTIVTFRLTNLQDSQDPDPRGSLSKARQLFEKQVAALFRAEAIGWRCTNPECPGPPEEDEDSLSAETLSADS